ncbi:MAG TPA: DUF2752 domain-containing protein [Bacteroidales bacterium]|nr:DUF2752 domain-containing protein [Bacteroidales bacterium]HSA43086.1 DUF2752 domain-containing protein [Bacteroidales bacterium]
MFNNSELICWVGGLTLLAVSNPSGTHYSVCPLHLLGLDFCPGCGLGHAVSLLLHGRLAESLETHPLGLPALFFILLRIYRLLQPGFILTFKKTSHGPDVYELTQH